jgi:replicative DNA helicase
MTVPEKHQNKFKKDSGEAVLAGLSSLIFSKMAPHATEMEKSVLGILMLEPDAIYTIIDILQPEDFYVTAHGHIYAAIIRLYEQSHRAEIIMVMEQLNKMGLLTEVGGPYILTECTMSVVSSANLEAQARIIFEKSLKRKSINLCAETIYRMYQEDEDVFNILDNHNERLFINSSGIIVRRNLTMAEIGHEFLKEVDEAWLSGGLTGVPIGIPAIDERTKGLQPSTLTVLGARTGHGKSAISAAMIHYCSKIRNPDYPALSKIKSKYPAAFLSLEMKNTEVFARLVSAELSEMGHDIPYERFKTGKDSENSHAKGLLESDLALINIAVERLAERGIYIDDTPDLNQHTLKSKIMKMILQYGVKIVFIDYAQLMSNVTTNKNATTTDNLSSIAKHCKLLAKLFNIPIVLLSQIDRETEKKEPRPPVKADLKGTGTLEESADQIILVWRPEVWSKDPVNSETQQSEKGIMYVDLVKHKQGKVHQARIPFDVATNSYGDMSISEEADVIKTFLNNHPEKVF